MNISDINKAIETHNFVLKPKELVVDWRNDNPGLGRKVATSAALVAGSLAYLIDSIISLTLAILTSPLLLCGVTTSISFAKRAFCCGVGAILMISLYQYVNFSEEHMQ